MPDLAVMQRWHKGRAAYCVWIYRICDARALRQIDDVLAPLSRLPGVLRTKNLHMTVFVAGFASDVVAYNDDVTVADLRRQIDVARRCGMGEVRLKTTGLKFDEHAMYFSMEDASDFTKGIRALFGGISREIRFADFMPHVTLAYYRERMELDGIAVQVEKINRSTQSIAIDHVRLELVALDARMPILPGIGICSDHYETLYAGSVWNPGTSRAGAVERSPAVPVAPAGTVLPAR